MSDLPHFSSYGYQVKRELGQNRSGGRVTYLAIHIKTRRPVVIKQFRFAQADSNWSSYDAYKQETQVLQGLNHPGIPRYLESFQTPDSFCMVQEYKKAPSLATRRSFDPDDIKHIAVAALEILVYLQNRLPSIIHRDLKPENILVDEQMNVYLVDFGLAHVGEGEIAMSSMVKGTLGFMAPEQLFNRQLGESSDLYGLGATLICLLTGTKSAAINHLVDDSYRLNFKHLVPKLSLRWISWLEKMVELRPKDRYANASAALEALKPIYVVRLPEAKLSQSTLELTATKLGEKVTHVLAVNNSIPDTVLEGTWEVAAHTSDPPHSPDAHTWISLQPAQFVGNQSLCRLTIHTHKLMANQSYEREILLHSNASPATHVLTLKVNTAPVPIKAKKLPYLPLAFLTLLATAAAWVEAAAWSGVIAEVGAIAIWVAVAVGAFMAVFGATTAVLAGSAGNLASELAARFGKPLRRIDTAVAMGVAGIVAMFTAGFGAGFRSLESVSMGFASVDGLVFFAGVGAASVAVSCLKRGFSTGLTLGASMLTTALGVSLGIGLKLGLMNPFVITAIATIGLPLAAIMIYPPLQRTWLIANYRKCEQYLIKP